MEKRFRIRHRVTSVGLRKLQDLGVLRGQVRESLHLGSRAAQDEWARFEAALPTPHQLEEGLIALTEDDIEHAVTKTRRLRDILHGYRRGVATA